MQSAAFDDEDGVRARFQSREAMRLIARMGEVVADAQFVGLAEHFDACGPAAEDDMFDRAPVSYTHLTLPTNTVTCRSRWSPYH